MSTQPAAWQPGAATVAGTLRTFAGRVPECLLSAAALADCDAVARHLPADLTHCLGFELALGSEAARADFALQVSAPAARRLLARAPWGWAGAGGAWARVRAFAEAWVEPGSALATAVPSVWLEYDIEPGAAATAVPSVFLTVDGAGADVVARGLALLAGDPLPAGVAAVLRDCAAALPPGGRLLQAGTMLARAPAGVRLCVAGLDAAAVPAYLRAAGWPGPTGAVQQLLGDLLGDADRVVVHLDVLGGLLGRIGLEAALDGNRELAGRRERRWSVLLDRLVARGLCRPDKRDGIAAWAGSARVQLPHKPWPTVLYRGLSHVKLTREPSGAVCAKGYIGVLPDQLTLLFDA